ncbi:MAG: tRNA-(ms[2]io[6]A)-hydroxylase, partial [Pseudomonadales bacterium]
MFTAPKCIDKFLLCGTPQAWLDAAVLRQDTLLIDHANCEKKAASTALAMLYRYVERAELLVKLSRLAREELRHFEQVLAIMQSRGIVYQHISSARYAAGLHELVAKNEPERLVDSLLVGALIEARSCERFRALAPLLDEELQSFYTSLLQSEQRHFHDY